MTFEQNIDKKEVYNLTADEVNELIVVARLKGKKLVVESQNRPNSHTCLTSHINGNVFSGHSVYSSSGNDDSMVWAADIKYYYYL